MNKLFVIILMVLMVGCSSPVNDTLPPTELSGVKVIEKHLTRWSYTVKLEKNKEQIELKVGSDEMYSAIQNGMTLDVSYDSNFYIVNVQFPNLK